MSVRFKYVFAFSAYPLPAAGCRLAGSAGAPAARWVADESGHAAVDGGRLREGRERGGAKPARLVR